MAASVLTPSPSLLVASPLATHPRPPRPLREGTQRAADDAHAGLQDGLDRLRGEVLDSQSAHEQLARDLRSSLQDLRGAPEKPFPQRLLTLRLSPPAHPAAIPGRAAVRGEVTEH